MASADVLSPSPGGGAIDVSRLSKFLSLPEDVISSLAGITEDYVTSVLRAIDERSREHDNLRADTFRIEVELEQAVRSADNRVKVMKTQLDSSLAETQDLRAKLNTSETARSALETELSNFKSSRTDVTEEVRVLKIRVQSLESDKRDTLDALDRKSTDYDRLQDEYTAAQSKAIESRREASSLETQLQQAQSAQTSAKFREQNLAQEVDLLKRNNEWLDGELKTKVAEFQKFRKEKAAQVSTLQRELDDALASVDATKRTTDNLKVRFDEVSKKAEDALGKIQDLQNQALQREESFGNEMNSQQRLAELFEKSAKSAKARVAELELLLEQEHERESAEIGRALAEAETERAEKEAAEARVAELEIQVERLEAELSTYASGGFVLANNDPGSPRGSVNGNATPRRRPGSAMGGTPGGGFASPAATARLQKSGLSITQLYSDYTAMKASFEAEKRRNVKLEEAINDLMADLEHKAPEIEELRQEHERLQKDLIDMSLLCEDAAKDKDKARKETRILEARILQNERESDVLRQQLRDFSSQVQVLLVEVEQRDSGADPLSAAQNRTYQQIVNGELSEDNQSDTDRLISQRLTVFRNVKEMQEQNQHLLKAIRDLGDKMEREEQVRKDAEAGKEGKELALLKSVVERLKDELKTLGTKAQSFIRERDMFRRMLQNRGDIAKPEQDETRSQVAESDAGSVTPAVNLAEVIRDLQSQYDQFKTEALENHNTLNEQTRRLAAEKSELGMQYARVSSQLELATERYEMLNGSFNMLKDENGQLRERLNGMHESQAKQDVRTQQVAEELVDCKSLIEGMRTENANLKAEKTLWKNIEQRLAQDNDALTQERGRLNGLIANLQSIQSERERAESENRRRLMGQNEKIENELQQTKRRLNEEIEEAKKLVVRKEIDARESQRKIDELNAALATTREAMIAAKTSQDHLQARVNELVIELETAKEKLLVYQPKPNAEAPAPAEDEDEDMVSREQELQMEVAELHRTLEFTKEELENVKSQVEQYKAIAQGSEEELQSMNESHDAYRESMEQEASEHEAKIKDLEQKLEATIADLASANQELAQLQQQEAEQSREFENDKKMLQAQIDGLKEDIEKNAAAVTFYKEDLRSQARIAQESQHNYERELVKHAEAAKSLQQVREEHAKLKTEVHQIQSEAESAKATLSSSEASWEAQKENYEKELGEVKTRCDDLMKQNKILLGQLDNVSMQVSTLQKSRAADDEMDEAGEHEAADKNIEDLREVIKYLRREKEIVDVQYELCLQESKRLKQQLDYSRATVDETRLLLAQERQREADQLRGATQHKELMEKISELNLLRESNSALRHDGERKGKKVDELQVRVEELQGKIEPLEDQVRNLEEEKEQKDKEIKLLTEHGERWQARAQQILNKYDRIDPAELEFLKEQAQKLQEQYDAVVIERESLTAVVQNNEQAKQTALNEVADRWRAEIKKVVDGTKVKLKEAKEAKARMVELEAEVETLKTQLNQVTGQLSQATESIKDFNAMKQQKAALEEQLAVAQKQVEHQRNNAVNFHREARSLKELNEKAQAEISQLRAVNAAATANAAPVAPMTEAAAPVIQMDEAAIEAEVARRLAAIPPPNITAAVEAEVAKRMTQIIPSNNSAAIEAAVAERLAQIPPPDNTAAVEAEVQRRMAAIPPTTDNAAAIEAEVQRRMALIPSPDNSAAIKAEVTRRLAEIEANQPTTTTTQEPSEISEGASTMSATDVEALVAERVAAERTKVEARIAEARKGFQEYKAAAVKKALDQKTIEVEKEWAAKKAEHKKQLAEMQATIDQLKKEIESLKQQLEAAKAKSDAEKTKSEAQNAQSENNKAKSASNEEELRKALAAKEQEHQEAMEALKKEEAAKLEEVTHQLQADFLQKCTESDSAKKPPTKEELTAIIKKNVEHRLVREKAKWESQVEAEREKLVEDRVSGIIEEKLKAKQVEMAAEMAANLEKSKDALRQEGMARIKVQMNMLEKKNKGLEERVKIYEAGGIPPPLPTTTPSAISAPPPVQQIPAPQPSGIKPPGHSAIPQPPPIQQNQGTETSQIPAPTATGQRRDAVGTGPAALRSLRGALASNIPRGGGGGGGAGGRGGGQIGRPPSQAGSHSGSPQQSQPPQQFPPLGQQMNLQGQQQPQFGGSRMSLPGGMHQQTQLSRGGAMLGRGQFQQRGQGRGGGGQGQGQMQQQQQLPNIQTGIPMQGQGQQGSAQSPGRIMNPGARQFVPVKRLRDDGTEADEGGAMAGKRPKGHNG